MGNCMCISSSLNDSPRGSMIRSVRPTEDDALTPDEVRTLLSNAGLRSVSPIFAVNFTKISDWTGHNPAEYERAMSSLGRVLETFDPRNSIHSFGFGDASTQDKHVFSFHEDNSPCNGIDCTLSQYREIVRNVTLGGRTSLVPIILAAIKLVVTSRCQYHVLVIFAQGQLKESVEFENDSASLQEELTMNAIVTASYFPLSIIVVGVGDSTFEGMQALSDKIGRRSPSPLFNNFKFVNFSDFSNESLFTLTALSDIPDHYKTVRRLRRRGYPDGSFPDIQILPPPQVVSQGDLQVNGSYQKENSDLTGWWSAFGDLRPSAPPYTDPVRIEAVDSVDVDSDRTCHLCCEERKNTALNCGHETCSTCARKIEYCPFCRTRISLRLPLFRD